MKAEDLKPGQVVSRSATQRGEPPMVSRTVRTVTPILGIAGVRVVFTDGVVLLYPNNNEV
jgi:hypothetical protein